MINKWTGPMIDPTSNFEKDIRSIDILPACYRLALFICKMLINERFNDVAAILDVGSSVTVFGGGLLAMANETKVGYTRGEIALLYDIMINYFDEKIKEKSDITKETLTVNWYVDYSPEYDFAEILSKGYKHIEKLRKESGGPHLPKGFGVGYKRSYNARGGCASISKPYGDSDIIIDNNGDALNEDPWKTFFDSGDPKHEDIANARIRFKNGTVCDLTASRVTNDSLRKIRIFQRDCYISLDYVTQEAIISRKTKNKIVSEKIDIKKEGPLKNEISSFVDCVINKKRPIVSGIEAYNALQVAHRIIKKLKT